MNLIALAFAVTALVVFVAFHFLPWSPLWKGWVVWEDIFGDLADGGLEEPPLVLAAASLLTESLLIVLLPFLLRMTWSSRLLWWTVTLVSGIATCALAGIILYFILLDPYTRAEAGPAVYCLVAAPVLNFISLLFVRREAPEPHAFPSPESH